MRHHRPHDVTPVAAQHVLARRPVGLRHGGLIDNAVVIRRGRVIDGLEIGCRAQVGQLGGACERAIRRRNPEQRRDRKYPRWRTAIAFPLLFAIAPRMQPTPQASPARPRLTATAVPTGCQSPSKSVRAKRCNLAAPLSQVGATTSSNCRADASAAVFCAEKPEDKLAMTTIQEM